MSLKNKKIKIKIYVYITISCIDNKILGGHAVHNRVLCQICNLGSQADVTFERSLTLYA